MGAAIGTIRVELTCRREPPTSQLPHEALDLHQPPTLVALSLFAKPLAKDLPDPGAKHRHNPLGCDERKYGHGLFCSQ
jgi:hypothetical protein